MQIVEKYPKLNGSQKKDLVLRVLFDLISKKNGDTSLLVIIPSFIDSAVGIAKEKIKIFVNQEQSSDCIFPCFRKQKK